MEQFEAFLKSASGFIWGPPLLVLLVGTGIFLTIRLRLIQVFKLGMGLRIALGKEGRTHQGEGDVTRMARD